VSAVTTPLTLTDTTALHPMMEVVTGRLRRKVIVIANGKGGVGKSSLAAALAEVLTQIGRNVLLVEMDPQGNNGEDLGFIGSDLYDRGEGQARAILDLSGFKPTGEARPGLWVVPGGEALEEITEELYTQRRAARNSGDDAWMYMYASAIAQVEDLYDQIILDVAPGSLVLQTQAMVAGDMILVPCRSDDSSRKGLRTVARRYLEARPYNPSLTLLGIVLFGVNTSGTRVQKNIRDLLEADVRGAAPVFETVIRYVESAAVACRGLGKVPHEVAEEEGIEASVITSAKRLAGDYRALATELLTRIAGLIRADES